MKILLTGSSGYIGSVLLGRLLERGDFVRCIDTDASNSTYDLRQSPYSSFEFIQGDICDERVVKAVSQDLDLVIHLAAVVGYPNCDANPVQALNTNVVSTFSLINAISKDVKLIFMSTCSVYGKTNLKSVDEKYDANPLTLYGKTKLDGENLVLARSGIVLRLATVYGPSPKPRFDLMPHDFIVKGLRSEKIDLFQPEAIRPLIHIDDVCSAILFCINNMAAASGNIYNVGPATGDSLTKYELASRIQEIVGLRFDCDLSKSDPDARSYELNCAKFNRLGFNPRVTLQHGLPQVAAWIKNQLAGGESSNEK